LITHVYTFNLLSQGVEHWKKFFSEHKSYRKIGRVSHPPIDPNSPIPEHCDPKKAQKEAAKAKQTEASKESTAPPPQEPQAPQDGSAPKDEL
jgi:hypothetical protein